MAGTKAGIKGALCAGFLMGLFVLAASAVPAAADPTDGSRALEVRFKADAAVRGSDPAIRARTDEMLEGVEDLLTRAAVIEFEPLVSGLSQGTASRIAAEARDADSESPNMADWYRVAVPAGRVQQALTVLRSSPLVDHANRAPVALPPPTTPDFSPLQLHLKPAPQGVGPSTSLADPRARGAGITIVDLEYYWTRDHEDLLLPAETDIGAPDYIQYTAFDDEHGTAVLGILGAKDNGFGVTGIVPDATLKAISPTMAPSFGYNPAGALALLAARLEPGDVVLIEQQADGPDPDPDAFDPLPLEWNQASFDAISQLSNLGVIVVETGANGGYDLDSPAMLGRFDRDIRDSGAILVGAGDSLTRAPLFFSSRGSRVDLQGHGNNIVTTGGYGELQGSGAEGRLVRYTNSFSGTSGAGPIVAGAVAAVLSYLKAKGQSPVTADVMVEILTASGTPQASPELGNIGPLPNISAALNTVDSQSPSVSINVPTDGATLGFGSDHRLRLDCDGGTGQELESCVATDRGPNGDMDLVDGDMLPTDRPGSHTITATATNRLGLTKTKTLNYSVGPGCRVPGVKLASVVWNGRKVQLLGITDPSRAGTKVIAQRAGRRAGQATVRSNGLIVATVKAPLDRRARMSAPYVLVVSGARSKPMKVSHGARILTRKPLARTDVVKVKLPGVKRKGSVRVRSIPVCGGGTRTRKVKHNRKGVFTVRLGFRPAAQTFSLRKGGRTVPLPVVLPAERFVLAD